MKAMLKVKNIGNPQSMAIPSTGSVSVWNYADNMSNDGEIWNISGTPAHAFIYIISNQSGEQQFLHRPPLCAPVSIKTEPEIRADYSAIKIRNEKNNPSWILPGIFAFSTYYQKKK